MRQAPTLLILVVIAFANFYFQGGSASPLAAPTAAVAKTNSEKQPEKTDTPQADTTCDANLRTAFDESFGEMTRGDVAALSEEASKNHVRFLIATVPDPVHTHLGLEFDRVVEGIQQAAAEEGYNFQSVNYKTLPWQVRPDSSNSGEVKITGFTVGSQREAYDLRVDKAAPSPKCPGLLVFRKHEQPLEAESFLIMLLVGEKPTEGVDTDQFLSALQAVRTINPTGVIGILGPQYSGSYFSLDRLLAGGGGPCLKDLPTKPVEYFVIRSSSTMSGKEINWFRSRNRCRASLVSFFDTFEYQQDKLMEFLRGSGLGHVRVALLSEDETAFGSFHAPDTDSPPELVKIYFPRGIATLRIAYQENASLVTDGEANRAPRSTLKPDFGASGEDEDTVPTFDVKHVPLSQEAVLQEIVRTLRGHRINFVIVRATDVMDTLFLAGQLRKSYPEGRLIALGADLLATRDKDDPTLRGALALSNYPPSQGWVDEHPNSGNDIHRIFADSVQEGEFNAALDLIEETRILTDNPDEDVRGSFLNKSGPSFLPMAHYAAFMAPNFDGIPDGTDNAKCRPRLWLNVIGRDGYWPLTVIGPNDNSDNREEAPKTSIGRQKRGGDASGPAPADRLKCAVASEPIYRGVHVRWQSHSLPFVPAIRVPVPDFSIEHFQVLNGLVVLLLTAITSAFIYSTWWGNISNTGSAVDQYMGPLRDQRRARLLMVGAAVLMVAWFLAIMSRWIVVPWIVISASAICHTWILHHELKWETALWTAGTAAATVGLYFIVRPRSPVMQFLFLYRADNFTSGLSPNLPLLLICAGMLWWIWYLLKARSSFDIRRPLLPRGDGLSQIPSHDRFGGAGSSRTLLFTRNFWFLATASLLALGFQKLRLHSLEGMRVDLVFNVSLFVLLLLLLNSLYGAWVYWQRCRLLLIALNRTPLRYSFMEISGFEWRTLWGLAGADSSFAYQPMVRAWQALERLFGSLSSSRQEYLAKADQELRDEAAQLIRQLEPIRNVVRRVELQPQRNSEKPLRRFQVRCREYWAGRAEMQMDFNQQFSRRIEHFQSLLSKLATMAYHGVLADYWQHDLRWVTRDPKNIGRSSDKELKDKKTGSVTEPVPPDVQWAEEFVSLVYVSFIIRVLIRIRWLGMSAVGIYVFLLLAATIYPFEPKATIHAFFVFVFLGMLGVIGLIYSQMHRDDTLSHLTDTEPGKLGGDYWWRMASFAGVPLFTLVTTQVPQLSGVLFFWVKPLLDGIGKG